MSHKFYEAALGCSKYNGRTVPKEHMIDDGPTLVVCWTCLVAMIIRGFAWLSVTLETNIVQAVTPQIVPAIKPSSIMAGTTWFLEAKYRIEFEPQDT